MRAARLLSENKTGRLCAVTFTRDAAAELKLRTLKLCGEREAQRLAVGTFHSVALSQIRRLKHLSRIKLLSDGERMGMLRRCYSQFKCKACWRAFKTDHLCALNFDQAFLHRI